jgi:hypothetical protein
LIEHHINISQIWRKKEVKNTCKISDTHITKLEQKLRTSQTLQTSANCITKLEGIQKTSNIREVKKTINL